VGKAGSSWESPALEKGSGTVRFNPDPKVPDTDFRDRNSVDTYLECGRFRRCANLQSIPARLPVPDVTVYLPVCTKSRFNRTGFASQIEMPVPGQKLGPFTYTTLGQWAPLISCPRDCREYKNRRLAKVEAVTRSCVGWIVEHVFKPAEILWAAFWAWVMK